MIREYIVRIDDSLKNADKDIDELETKWGAEELPRGHGRLIDESDLMPDSDKMRNKMTREEAVAIIRREYLCVDRDCDIEKNCSKCDLVMPSKEPILEAYKMAIKALEQEPVLDKISSEIKEHADRLKDSLYGDGLRHALEIIDKYKGESED